MLNLTGSKRSIGGAIHLKTSLYRSLMTCCPVSLALGHGVSSGDLWKLGYEYGELNADGTTVNTTKNTGNIAKQTLSFNGLAQPFVQAYKYDSLYRLTEARETNNGNQTWKQNT